jgi:hypothetical protein
MTLHENTFLYLKPTEKQMFVMEEVREAYKAFTDRLQRTLPDGPDKTYVIRLIRDAAMWTHVCITRHSDGSPRE